MFRVFTSLSFLLISSSALASENAFNANMDHPMISAAITEFENVCFPFIEHETELTAEQDREMFQSRMVEAGYNFGDEKAWKGYKNLGLSSVLSYTPGYTHPPVISRTEGKYTFFSNPDLMAEQAKRSEGQRIENRTGEFIGPAFTPNRMTDFIEQRYRNRMRPISAYLTWQHVPDYTEHVREALKYRGELYFGDYRIRTSFPPASSCTVLMHDESLTADLIKSKIINGDPDWRQRDIKNNREAHFWTQCTNEGQENYIYEVSQTDATLFLSVKTLHDDEYAEAYGC